MDEGRMAVVIAETLAKQGINPVKFGSRLFKAMEEVKREGLSTENGEALVPEKLVGDEEEERITISNKAMSQICTLAGVEYDVEKQEEGDRRMIFGRPYEYRSGEWSPADGPAGEEEAEPEEETEMEPGAMAPEEEGPSQAEAEELLDEMDPEEALEMLESGEITEGPALTQEDAMSAIDLAGVEDPEGTYAELRESGYSDEEIANMDPDQFIPEPTEPAEEGSVEALRNQGMDQIADQWPGADVEQMENAMEGLEEEELQRLAEGDLEVLDETFRNRMEEEELAFEREEGSDVTDRGILVEDHPDYDPDRNPVDNVEGLFDMEAEETFGEDVEEQFVDYLRDQGYEDVEIANMSPDTMIANAKDFEAQGRTEETAESETDAPEQEEIDDGEPLSQDERDAFVTDAYNEALENGDVSDDDAEEFIDFMNSAPDEQIEAWASGEENPADTFYGVEPTEAEGIDVGEEDYSQRWARAEDALDALGVDGAERGQIMDEFDQATSEEQQKMIEEMEADTQIGEEDTSVDTGGTNLDAQLDQNMIDTNQRAADMLTTEDAQRQYEAFSRTAEDFSDEELSIALEEALRDFENDESSTNAAKLAGYFEEADMRATNP